MRYGEARLRRHTLLAGQVLIDRHALAVDQTARHDGIDTGVAGAALGEDTERMTPIPATGCLRRVFFTHIIDTGL